MPAKTIKINIAGSVLGGLLNGVIIGDELCSFLDMHQQYPIMGQRKCTEYGYKNASSRIVERCCLD